MKKMSKAVLVFDMPSSCDSCPLFGNYYSDMCCKGLNNRSINYPYPKDFRQDWCPLREIPEKYVLSDDDNVFDVEWLRGFNYCINRILDMF